MFERVIPLLAIVLATSASVRAEDEPEAIREALRLLKSKGCFIETDESGIVVTFGGGTDTTLADADMAMVARFRKLKSLYLDHRRITDKGFQLLAPIEDLDTLHLNATLITDASLDQIAKWKHLRTLSLPGSITNAGLRRLEGLTEIDELSCGSTQLTDESVDTILKFTHLHFISLGPNVTPAGYERLSVLRGIDNIAMYDVGERSFDDSMMAVLAKFPNLRQLNLHVTRITDAGLPHLAKLHNLTVLTLPQGTTDAGLAHVAHLRKLERLDLQRTSVTNAGLAALAEVKSLHSLRLPPTTGDRCLALFSEHQIPLAYMLLTGKGYTDECIPALIAMKSLSNVDHLGTAITAEGIKRLQGARPDIRINR
jgi:hypothetical protein